jgi:hypothetical protein
MSVATFNYNPKVSNPKMSINITQMKSQGFQTPFYFGGSSVPYDLGMPNITRGSSVKHNSYKSFNRDPTKTLVARPYTLPFRK